MIYLQYRVEKLLSWPGIEHAALNRSSQSGAINLSVTFEWKCYEHFKNRVITTPWVILLVDVFYLKLAEVPGSARVNLQPA